MNQKINKLSGFTLLEVMVAMVIFSVGMLGLAGIQGLALQNNSTSYMRTMASQQAYNMSDLLRSNTDRDGKIDTTFDNIVTSLGTVPTKNCIADNQTTNCSESELADFDIYHWKLRLADELPSGRGKVTKSANVYTIIIMWDEDRTGVTAEGCGGNSKVDLNCYTIRVQV